MAIRDRAKEREFFILILCVFVTFALRFYTFGQKSLWGPAPPNKKGIDMPIE